MRISFQHTTYRPGDSLIKDASSSAFPCRLAALALAACVVLSGCAAHDDFVKTQTSGSLQAWSDYVKKYPVKGHPGCDDCLAAQKALDAALAKEKVEWSQAQSAGTAAAYMDFLSNRSKASPYYETAQTAQLDLLKKGQAEEGDYLTYLNKRSDDAQAADVRHALMSFRYGKAKAGEAGQAAYFESQYPGTAEAAKLAPHWAAKEFEKAKANRSRLSLEFFLKRFPDSGHANEAEALLANLPHSEPIADNGEALALLPKYREVSTALRGQECLSIMADLVKATGAPYGAAAERIRGDFASASNVADIAACRDAELRVPTGSRAVVGSAVRSLVVLSQRRARLGGLFSGPDEVGAKSRKIGKTSSQLSEAAEAFDLEMQAYYGYMPADPDKPSEKASRDAAEALRRAQRAFELTQGGFIAMKKKDAAEALDLMNAQEELLVKVIAYHEKPERRAP
jgi:hypothetical protein